MEKLCNMCGLSCELSDSHGGNYGLIEAMATGGYFSTPGYGALDDVVHYAFSLCEFCLDFIFSNFVIPPLTRCHLESEPHNFIPAKDRVLNDSWRKMKEEFLFRKLERDLNRNIIKKDS